MELSDSARAEELVDVELSGLFPFITIREERDRLSSVLLTHEDLCISEGGSACECLVVGMEKFVGDGWAGDDDYGYGPKLEEENGPKFLSKDSKVSVSGRTRNDEVQKVAKNGSRERAGGKFV